MNDLLLSDLYDKANVQTEKSQTNFGVNVYTGWLYTISAILCCEWKEWTDAWVQKKTKFSLKILMGRNIYRAIFDICVLNVI